MPGLNFSFNVGFGESSNGDVEEKKAPKWESPLTQTSVCKGKFTVVAAIGMVVELMIAVYFIIGVYTHSPNLFFVILTIPFCLLFIVGSLKGIYGILTNNGQKLVGFIWLQRLFLIAALPLFGLSLVLTIDPSLWADGLTTDYDNRRQAYETDNYMRFVGIHNLVISVFGVPWALFFSVVTKKAQEEILMASQEKLSEVPPPYEEASTLPETIPSVHASQVV